MMSSKENVVIFGDSYSTYKGYVPVGYDVYYADKRDVEPIVKGVEKTWWKLLEKETGFNIVLNDSYSGSTVCNTVREGLPPESSFIRRMDKYINEDFFNKNSIETVFVFGGTNDWWIGAPEGELKYSDWTSEDLDCLLPAYCYMLATLKDKVRIKNIFAIFNCNLDENLIDKLVKACEYYNIKYIRLENIDKISGHPTELGMQQICEQVKNLIEKK